MSTWSRHMFRIFVLLLLFFSVLLYFDCGLYFTETSVAVFHSFKVNQRISGLDKSVNVAVEGNNETVLDNNNVQNGSLINHNSLMYRRQKGRNITYELQTLPSLEELFNTTQYPVTVDKPFLLENPGLCSSVDNLTIIVTINSAPYHFKFRHMIRNTWTNDSYYEDPGIRIRTVFLLGRTNTTIQQKVTDEFKKYQDIVQGDFTDYYYNLTHKSVMGLKWLTERCRNAKFVLKTDDDMIVNMFKLFAADSVRKRYEKTHVFCHREAEKINRNSKSKWYASENFFKEQKTYLPYCKGKFVWMKNDVIPTLFKAAARTPFYHLDDVAVFGYAMHNIKGLTYSNFTDSDWTLHPATGKNCLSRKKANCPYIVIATDKPEDMLIIWQKLLRAYRHKK